jgi:acyl dehydratase
MQVPDEGDVFRYERTFTTDDVQEFGELSADQQALHVEPNDAGELLVHGLLTATLPTKIGADLGLIATSMEFEFVRPVYTGQTITCTVQVRSVQERDDRFSVGLAVACHNEDEEVTLRGGIDGILWKARDRSD